MGDFHGEPTGTLENEFLRLEYLLKSPRIVRLNPASKANLFADLGKDSLTTPYGDFYFRGGHRLWHAPEEFPRTYVPDNTGSTVEPIQNGVRIQQPVEPWTSIVKVLEIALDTDKPNVRINHLLRNDGQKPVRLAPWALSMMRLGGVAVIPQPPRDGNAKLPNRHLVFWPYSRIKDPRLHLGDDFVLVHADSKLPALKFGCLVSHGWMGYWLDQTFFVKRFAPAQTSQQYPDRDSNVEIYCNDKFIELETLGPMVTLESGAEVQHVEVWELYDTTRLDWIPVELQKQLEG